MEGNQVVKLIVTQPAPHDGDDEVDNGPFFCIMLNVESEWEKIGHNINTYTLQHFTY